MNKKLIVEVLKIIILNPDVLGSMPNLPMKVMDKGVFWNVIGENGGWKIE